MNNIGIQVFARIYPNVAKISLMARCKIKLCANFKPDQPMKKEFIVGSFFGDAVKKSQSLMNKGFMDNSTRSFMQH